MKHTRALFAALAAALCMAALSACFSPWAGGEGAITVAFGDSWPRGRAALQGDEIAGLVHQVTLTGPGETVVGYIYGAGSASFAVMPGAWTVRVRAIGDRPDEYNENYFTEGRMLRAIGFDEVEVAAGRSSAANISMISAVEVSCEDQLLDAICNAERPEGCEKIILITGDIEISDTVHIEASPVNITLASDGDVTISRGSGGHMFDVAGDSNTLRLGWVGMAGSIAIDGSGYAGEAYSIISVAGATLEMNDGVTLTGNNADGYGGAVRLSRGATFCMRGGTIYGNASDHGGGVYVESGGGAFIMRGGRVTGNEASHGGGVFVGSSAHFAMRGGTIQGNAVGYIGGGVLIDGGTFEMFGGTISGNTAINDDTPPDAVGGGVLVQGNGTFVMHGGAIAGNEAMRGGGVFVGNSSNFYMLGGFVFGADGAAHAPRGAPNTVAAGGSGAALYVATSGTAQFNGPLAAAFGMYMPRVFNDTLPAAAGVILNGRPFSSLADAFQAIYGDADYYVVEVLRSLQSAPIDQEFPHNTNIILRGASPGTEVALSSPGSLFTINYGAALTLENIALRGREGNNAALVAVETGGTLTMNAGALIAGNANNSTDYSDILGGGVHVAGNFTMNAGAEISGNASIAGGGVFIASQGVFNMDGGNIYLNNAGEWGGGGVQVESNGQLFMRGNATISTNFADGGGGGVNISAWEDYGGEFTMLAGTITGNRAYGSGGGVFVHRSSDAYGRFYMLGGTIHNNRATSNSNGGGVFVSGRFDMSEDSPGQPRTISNNIAEEGDGGGVFIGVYGIFEMRGNAAIQGNEAIDGGGVFVGGFFVGESGIIRENTATRNGGGVFIAAGADFQRGNSLQINNNTGDDDVHDSSDN